MTSGSARQALTKAIAAAAAGDDQRHRSRGNGAVGVTDKALDDARVAPADASLGSGRDALLVGPAQQPLHQAKAVEQPGGKQFDDDREVAFIVRGHCDVRQDGANLVGDVADQTVQHRRHQRAFLLRQPLRGIEEKVDAHSGQPSAALAARGRVLVGCECSDRPFFRHHCACDYPICVNFPSTESSGARAGR